MNKKRDAKVYCSKYEVIISYIEQHKKLPPVNYSDPIAGKIGILAHKYIIGLSGKSLPWHIIERLDAVIAKMNKHKTQLQNTKNQQLRSQILEQGISPQFLSPLKETRSLAQLLTKTKNQLALGLIPNSQLIEVKNLVEAANKIKYKKYIELTTYLNTHNTRPTVSNPDKQIAILGQYLNRYLKGNGAKLMPAYLKLDLELAIKKIPIFSQDANSNISS